MVNLPWVDKKNKDKKEESTFRVKKTTGAGS